jgi:multidrug efflux pump subunit AcrB
MAKKLSIAVGAVIVGLLVITFTGVGTVLKVKLDDACVWMDKQVPPETQLKNLRAEIDKIDKDIKKNLSKLAAMEVECDKLEANVTAMKEDQTKLRSDITKMSEALDGKTEKVSFNGRNYRTSELTIKLESAVNTYEVRKTDIKTKDQLLTQKRQSLDLAHKTISDMRDQKEKLRVMAAKLETRIENVKLKQVDCPISMDNSQVSKCNALAEKLDRILAEEEKKTELFDRYGYGKKSNVVSDEKSKEDVLQAAKRALQDDEEDKVAVEKK